MILCYLFDNLEFFAIMYVFYPGGMSHEYADTYLKFHHDLKILQLDDTEMASLSAIALFSAGILCV